MPTESFSTKPVELYLMIVVSITKFVPSLQLPFDEMLRKISTLYMTKDNVPYLKLQTTLIKDVVDGCLQDHLTIHSLYRQFDFCKLEQKAQHCINLLTKISKGLTNKCLLPHLIILAYVNAQFKNRYRRYITRVWEIVDKEFFPSEKEAKLNIVRTTLLIENEFG